MGEEIAITFETLYELLMREKQREELLPLEPAFFQDVLNYLQEKMKVLERVSKENDLFSIGEREKVEMEIRNIRKVLKDLYERRERKIIELAVNKSRTAHALDAGQLLDEEQQFLDALVAVLDHYRSGVLMQLLQLKLPQVQRRLQLVAAGAENHDREKKPAEQLVVRFLHAVPKFVGRDLAIYGPFESDDVAGLPRELAEILLEKKRVVIAGKGEAVQEPL